MKAKKAVSMTVASIMLLSSPLMVYANKGNAPVDKQQQKIESAMEIEEEEVKDKVKFEAKTEKQAEKTERIEEKAINQLEKLEDKLIKIQEKQERLLELYTEEEVESIKALELELEKKDKSLKVLPFDNVFSNKGKLKFDTPPVIKGGRTLIPVRAITEGFGAEVVWDKENQLVTITKDDIVIEIYIDSRTVYVNGVAEEIEVPAEILSSRTYVPLRFIAETLGLKVRWDEETRTIEIDEEDEDEVDQEVNEDENDNEEAEEDDIEEAEAGETDEEEDLEEDEEASEEDEE